MQSQHQAAVHFNINAVSAQLTLSKNAESTITEVRDQEDQQIEKINKDTSSPATLFTLAEGAIFKPIFTNDKASQDIGFPSISFITLYEMFKPYIADIKLRHKLVNDYIVYICIQKLNDDVVLNHQADNSKILPFVLLDIPVLGDQLKDVIISQDQKPSDNINLAEVIYFFLKSLNTEKGIIQVSSELEKYGIQIQKYLCDQLIGNLEAIAACTDNKTLKLLGKRFLLVFTAVKSWNRLIICLDMNIKAQKDQLEQRRQRLLRQLKQSQALEQENRIKYIQLNKSSKHKKTKKTGCFSLSSKTKIKSDEESEIELEARIVLLQTKLTIHRQQRIGQESKEDIKDLDHKIDIRLKAHHIMQKSITVLQNKYAYQLYTYIHTKFIFHPIKKLHPEIDYLISELTDDVMCNIDQKKYVH